MTMTLITNQNAAAPLLSQSRAGTIKANGRASGQAEGRGLDGLGQGDFLRLMTAQLRTQDPFEPVDNTQMLAQMAQFSSLSGITEINESLKAISNRLDQLLPNTPSTPAP